jgi:hypothetical protein
MNENDFTIFLFLMIIANSGRQMTRKWTFRTFSFIGLAAFRCFTTDPIFFFRLISWLFDGKIETFYLYDPSMTGHHYRQQLGPLLHRTQPMDDF